MDLMNPVLQEVQLEGDTEQVAQLMSQDWQYRVEEKEMIRVPGLQVQVPSPLATDLVAQTLQTVALVQL